MLQAARMQQYYLDGIDVQGESGRVQVRKRV